MIRLEAALDKENILVAYSAAGHAGTGPRGEDIVCAAVSTLSRTLVRALSCTEGIKIQAEAPERGVFSAVINYTENAKQFLQGAGTFLLEGLKSIEEEYPACCKLTIKKAKKSG
ncbi:MAG: ribosomal-processing cysteine protease Prp [Spirochaetaceae bacterium]|jgi:uncharacterized protein YsxB (DUF464 family)|nr:ribosomal-processing cysteine protease Prp [Spirochaetaceae bacterium]